MREENIRRLLESWQTDGTDENYMRCAMALAEMGAEAGEVPVGAVLVKDGVILCGDYNGREETISQSNTFEEVITSSFEKLTSSAVGAIYIFFIT